MLDLGVGAGRTTLHFAPRTAHYVGVDYSAPLIAECRRRFPSPPWRVRFEHADARSIPMVANESFDLVLFSVNGLDCLDDGGRREALAETWRVCKPGATFFFSSHNLEAIATALSLRAHLRALRTGRSPLRFLLAVVRHLPEQVLKRIANPSPRTLVQRDWVWITKLWPPGAPQMTYHAKPLEIRRQLEEVGFVIDRVLLPTGETVDFDECADLREVLWLNFWCRKVRASRDRHDDS